MCDKKDSEVIEGWYKSDDGSSASRGNCEVQHIIPKKDEGSNHPLNLITLCRKCHLSTFKTSYGGIPGIPNKNQETLVGFSNAV